MIGRANVLLNGGVALVVTLIVSAQSAGLIGATLTGLALAIALIPYFAVLSKHPNKLPQLPLPSIVTGWLVSAITSEQRDKSADERDDRSAGRGRLTTADALSILPLLSVILGSSIGMVKTAELGAVEREPTRNRDLRCGDADWAAQLDRLDPARDHGRGAALSSEAFNSDTLNLLVGGYLPTFFVAVSPLPHEGLVSMLWLAAITFLVLVIGIDGSGFGRWTGGLLLAFYAAFPNAVLH